jgi:uncharacterized membrane protein YebE (DUF533 family)
MDLHRQKAELEAEEQVELTTLERVERLGAQQGEIFRAYQRDKIRWSVVTLAGFLALIGIAFVVYVGFQSDSDDRETQRQLGQAISDIEEQRATARQSSCDQAVDFATAHNHLVQRQIDLLSRIFGSSSDPDTQAALAEEIASYNEEIVPVRDCSAQGLEDFANGTGGYLP